MAAPSKIQIGDSFGRLTVVQQGQSTAKGRHWLCKCSCGQSCEARSDRLSSGKTKSCGCIRRDPKPTGVKIGDQFGRLTVLGPGPRFEYYNVSTGRTFLKQQWVCKCSCGNPETLLVRTGNLTSGKSTSCGCYQRENTIRIHTTHGCTRGGRGSSEYRLFMNAKNRAKRQGLPFDLELSDIVIPNRCPLLGIEIDRHNSAAQKNSPSLDKVVPEKGYVKGNVMVISHMANAMKSDASIEQLLTFAKNIKLIFQNELHPTQHVGNPGS